MTAHDLQRLQGEALAVLPDPVGVDGGDFADRRSPHVREHGQRHIEVVVGMAAPGQPPVAAGLRHAHAARHRPKMRVGQRNVHALQRQRMAELAPIGGDHVGGRGQARGTAKFGHYLATREAVFCAARVFRVGDHAPQVAHQANRVFEPPAAVRVERDAGGREVLVQGAYRLNLLLAAQHTAFELEVVETVFLAGCLSLAHDGFGSQSDIVANTKPVVVCAGIAHVIQVSLAPIAHVKQIAQHLHTIALLAFAEQGRHGHIQVLAEQVKQRRLNCGNRMNGGAQVKRLLAAATDVKVGELLLHLLQDALVRADGLAHNQRTCVVQRLANLLAARHFAHAGSPGVIGQYQQIARKEGAVRATQV